MNVTPQVATQKTFTQTASAAAAIWESDLETGCRHVASTCRVALRGSDLRDGDCPRINALTVPRTLVKYCAVRFYAT